jgi:benzodiazapine receptor
VNRSVRDGLVAAGLPLAAAAVGSLGSRRAPALYARLRKPGWAPPAGAFGPVWTALYVMIGAAGWRVRTRSEPDVESLHVLQLVLNAAWPATFFEVRDRRVALAVIAALDLTVGAEVLLLLRRDPAAAGLLTPYLLWSLYATALTAAVSDPD